jgi:hypothetical protein
MDIGVAALHRFHLQERNNNTGQYSSLSICNCVRTQLVMLSCHHVLSTAFSTTRTAAFDVAAYEQEESIAMKHHGGAACAFLRCASVGEGVAMEHVYGDSYGDSCCVQAMDFNKKKVNNARW